LTFIPYDGYILTSLFLSLRIASFQFGKSVNEKIEGTENFPSAKILALSIVLNVTKKKIDAYG
jgi:hypothetical protein